MESKDYYELEESSKQIDVDPPHPNEKEIWLGWINYFARKNNLDPKLVQAIITHESAWDQYACRYEAHYQWLYKEVECSKKSKVTLVTEINTQKMSFGLGQIMGAVARELGFEGSLMQLCQASVNIDYVCRHLGNFKKVSNNSEDIIAMYNGGRGALHKLDGEYKNQGYVDSVKKIYESLLQKN